MESQAPFEVGLAPLGFAIRTASGVLRKYSVPFALCGGVAVGIWGRQRFTTDVDFAVFVKSMEQLEELVRISQPFGFLSLDPDPWKFKKAWVGRLLVAPGPTSTTPDPVVIDLIRPSGRGGDRWIQQLLQRATVITLFGEAFPIVRPEDLVVFKLLVEPDRGYDMEDARSVLVGSSELIDRPYLIDAAKRLGVRTKLRKLGI